MTPSTPIKHTMPNGDVVWYRDSDHSYWKDYNPATNSCSGRVSGASGLAANDGDTDKGGFAYWVSKLTCEGMARVFHYDPPWPQTGDDIWNRLRELKLTWEDIRDEAGTRGTVSHNVLQALAEGKAPTPVNGYDEAVMDWWEVREPEPILVEQVVYDRENNLAGRPDLMYRPTPLRPDHPILTDLKTAKNLRNEYAIQLNLYALALEAAGFIIPQALSILHVAEDGSWQEVPVPINPDWAYNAMAIASTGKQIRSILTAAQKSARKGKATIKEAA